ncbi:MAG: ribonuclease HI family protein [Anaerolineae bacterium]|nr:ribonuclease HI family protein [Anaerolineae bacterium]
MISQPPEASPLRTVIIVFDGGSRGNPGEGYGSFILDLRRKPGEKKAHRGSRKPGSISVFLGEDMTNNEAEYDTLLYALKTLLTALDMQKEDPKGVALEIRGDSLLVINHVTGEWKAREERLAKRRDQVRNLLARFGQYHLVHQPRAQSVALLGH